MRKKLALTQFLKEKDVYPKVSRSLSPLPVRLSPLSSPPQPNLGGNSGNSGKQFSYIRYTRTKDHNQPFDNSFLLTEMEMMQNKVKRISIKQLLCTT